MNFLRKHWQDLGVVVGLLVCIYVMMNRTILSELTMILWLNFVAILIHQFEEYRWPGTFAGMFNVVLFKSETPDRYPLNKQSAMIINVIIAYVFYLLPVLFPSIVWLGLAPILMGFFQVIWHGIFANIKAKSVYNPGLFAAIFLHVPIGIWYINNIVDHHLSTTADWILGATYFIVAVYILIVKGNLWLRNKNSPYSFSKKQLGAYYHKLKDL
ncbi:HXXEE domain-containing protein [Paenibacillus sp. SYP-B3998]|uniref:HXXEE domain-containing protein n=1 Tax=Paenibacillus sp. SYP-B3998 TaxID=2678564 RepID=A0A6G3ZYW8_9BACL|nr:HXXEE domain-containing protein [Paenibacillus sp. SYP-B3998]NEW06779.1 HXXEE domain-containing protein [Paenibacillus sp. SYP-B3998]